MNAPILRSAVELRLCEICGRFLQNLIGAFQLAILALEFFQSLSLIGGQARTLSISLGLA